MAIYKKIFLSLSIMGAFGAGNAAAWQFDCEVDSFTDEETCKVSHQENGYAAVVTVNQKGGNVVIALGDGETLYFDEMMVRVDSNEAYNLTNLADLQAPIGTGAVIGLLPTRISKQLLAEMQEGDMLRVRLNKAGSGFQDFTMDLDGFDEPWRQLSSSQDIDIAE